MLPLARNLRRRSSPRSSLNHSLTFRSKIRIRRRRSIPRHHNLERAREPTSIRHRRNDRLERSHAISRCKSQASPSHPARRRHFLPHHFAALQSDILPCINQIEFHPGYLQEDAYAYSVNHNILVEAWRPLGQGGLIGNEKVKDIAAKHNKSTAQILLRYSLQRGVLPLPKTTHLERMLENQKLFDFALSDKEMSELNNLPLCAWSGEHPDTAIPRDD